VAAKRTQMIEEIHSEYTGMKPRPSYMHLSLKKMYENI
jgi:hypothetical protein